MKIRTYLIAATVLAGVSFAGMAANAATVTKTYDFTFSSFLDPFGGVAPPIATVTASFTLTFDPALSYSDDTADIAVNSLNVPVGSAIGFSAVPQAPYFISIGGVENGAGLVGGGTNDFVLQLRFPDADHLDMPSLPLCSDPGFSCGGLPTTYASGYTSVDHPGSLFLARVATVSPAPEPAGWAIMLLGFGGLGATIRRRRKTSAMPA